MAFGLRNTPRQPENLDQTLQSAKAALIAHDIPAVNRLLEKNGALRESPELKDHAADVAVDIIKRGFLGEGSPLRDILDNFESIRKSEKVQRAAIDRLIYVIDKGSASGISSVFEFFPELSGNEEVHSAMANTIREHSSDESHVNNLLNTLFSEDDKKAVKEKAGLIPEETRSFEDTA